MKTDCIYAIWAQVCNTGEIMAKHNIQIASPLISKARSTFLTFSRLSQVQTPCLCLHALHTDSNFKAYMCTVMISTSSHQSLSSACTAPQEQNFGLGTYHNTVRCLLVGNMDISSQLMQVFSKTMAVFQ